MLQNYKKFISYATLQMGTYQKKSKATGDKRLFNHEVTLIYGTCFFQL